MVASDGTPFKFGVNKNGEYGYIVTDSEGADSVIPFKRFGNIDSDGWSYSKQDNGRYIISNNVMFVGAENGSYTGCIVYKTIDLTNINSIIIKTFIPIKSGYYLKNTKPTYNSSYTALPVRWAETIIDTSTLEGNYYFGIHNAFRSSGCLLYDMTLK